MSRLGSIAVVVVLLACQPLRAENWLTGWLPGKSEASTTKTSRRPLLDGKPLRQSSRASAGKDPSLWDRMTNGTRNLASKTKDTLSWNDTSKTTRTTRNTYWDDPPARSSKKSKDEPGFWGRLFGRDESRPSKTVSDFLSQERPEAR